MHMHTSQIFRAFAPFAILITLFSGLLYVVVRQDIRLAADEPQVFIAQDIITMLEEGAPPEQLSSGAGVEINRSSSPFVVIYDAERHAVSGNGVLYGKPPTPPRGVFDAAQARGQDRVTWSPAPGLRFAMVLRYYEKPQGGYVLVARSLGETDYRLRVLCSQVALGWASMMLFMIALQIFLVQKLKFTWCVGRKKG